ncbi:MAG: ATP-dependent helicase [Fibrobacter sp.]|nr:ATP-dependent helicase [Fibrobacter sp.]
MSYGNSKLELNANQQEAINWGEGPLVVLAGPGSGKTTVLTERIIKILHESPEARFRVLALTFTQNAARNMQEKIDQAISASRERAYLTTFHSFCSDVIRQHGDLEGIKANFSIMTQDLDRESLLLEVIAESKQKGFDFSKEDIRYLPKINSYLEQCLEMADAPNPDSELNAAKYLFFHYLQKMRSTGRIDYAGILYFAWQLLGRKHIAKHYQVVYKYVCVDEYQDTNIAQFKVLTRLLKPSQPNLFVVADDDQIVYQWNGASPERLKQIIGQYKAKIIQLPENYRCPAEVVSIANKMISHNNNRLTKKQAGISLLKEDSAIANAVSLEEFINFQAEVSWIAEDIKAKKFSPKHTKIMGRNRKLLEETQEILNNNGITAVIHQRKTEFESFPMRFLHALLRGIVSRADKVQIQRLSAAFYQLEGVNIDVHSVIGMASLTNSDLLKAWLHIAIEREGVSETTKSYLTKIDADRALINFSVLIADTYAWFNDFSDQNSTNPEIFDNFLQEKGIWELLYGEIKGNSTSDLTLAGLLQELDLRDKSAPIPHDAFELITIHGAKGLEFDHVYLLGMVEDILPSYNSIKPGARPEFLEEERRSCYVAITRTQKTLTLTYSQQYKNWPKDPSRFLYEMGLLY